MKKTTIEIWLLVGIVMILLLASCQSKPLGYVDSFERFVERVEKNASSYSQEQWEKNDEKLQNYIERYDKEKKKLSSDEKKKVGELTVRYYKARVKSLRLNILGEIGDWIDYLQGFANEIMKDVENYQEQ
jgi:secreted Zn-dependent insulinase-like peptidase